uniref:WD repeat containing protein mio n=1 Tax=Echinococcus granulosus TaxID=6210 RepID=A0A068W9T6_ECHGR|nr:WD repeat containing protein mio [Echinococcus granulosus]
MTGLTDIVWSPNHEDRFCVIFQNIIFLLRITDFDGSLSESGRKSVGLSSGSVKLTSAFLHWNPWRTSLLAQGLDRGKHNRASSVLVWDVIRETGAKQQFATNANSEFSSGLPADSLYNMDKFAGDTYVKDRRMHSFCDRPLCDACQNESVVSFAWVSKNSFVVGLASRHIKLYDISDTAKTIQMTQTRLVNGLTSDPLLPTRFASFCQNQIGLWTSENLEKPIYIFSERKEVVCMKWSPLREGWLGVLLADSVDIRVYNALLTFSRPMEECEQFLSELRATTSRIDDNGSAVTGTIAPFVSFAWHGSIVNCIITIDHMGCLNVAKVNEMTALTWSPNHTLLWTVSSAWLGLDRTGLFGPRGYTFEHSGICAVEQEGAVVPPSSPSAPSLRHRHFYRRSCLSERFANGIAQLAAKFNANLDSAMQKRADAGYGLEVVETPYSEIVADDPQLRSLWILIEYLQECVEDWAPYGKSQDPTWGGVRGRTGITTGLRCQGALAILCGDEPTASKAIDGADWQGIDAHLPFPRYSSSKRSRVLRMCMWPLDAPADVQRRVFESVCSNLEFERAAAMALINLQFDWALSFLSRASEYRRTKEIETELDQVVGASAVSTSATALTASETDLIGLALSGFSDSRNHLWRNACADVLGRLHNPYLRLMFKFLTVARGDFSSDVDFMEILENESLSLIDRLAFACLYLNDDKLSEYVLSTFHRMLGDGRLEAVLLTGLSSGHFFDLLQHYVDLTFDVQTAAILGLHACYLCRRAAPPTSTAATAATTTTLTTSTPAAARVVGTGQSRMRLRGYRNGADRSSLLSATGLANAASPSADKMVAKLGGRQLANWVETYRDMLDRWRMWFYRVDFDNYYATRLVTPFFYASVQSRASSGAVSSSLSGNSSRETSLQSAAKPLPPITPVRGIGLPAAASQIFASCIYCGWRLGGVVRGTVEEPTSTPVPSPAATPTAAPAVAVAAVASGAGAGCRTSMHAGGGKQTICWHCLKPLPRCSICLMHMGSEVSDLTEAKMKTSRKKTAAPAAGKTATSSIKGSVSDATGVTQLEAPAGAASLKIAISSKTAEEKKSAKINIPLSKKPEVVGGSDDASRGGPLRLASWFVWCQACRHGGHASHIFDWFYGGGGASALSPNLIECPVNGCCCHCASLDSSVPQPRPTPPPPTTTTTTVGGAAAGDETSRDTTAMMVTMHELTLNSALSPLSSSSSLTSPALTPMDASPYAEEVGGKLLRRSPVTPASVPKNRREIVDPVVLAMADAEKGDEGMESED